MKAWRRTSRSGSTSTVTPTVLVLSVVANGTQTVVWTFDHTIDVVNDPSGLEIAGDSPIIDVGAVGAVLTLIFGSNHSAGEAWNVDASSTDITFIPPDALLDQSGLTA